VVLLRKERGGRAGGKGRRPPSKARGEGRGGNKNGGEG